MSEFVDKYIQKYKPSLLKAEKYIKDNDWTTLGEIREERGKIINPKKDEFLVQDQSIINLVDRLKYFAKKADGYHKLPQFKKYIKHVMKVVNIHTDRVDNYINGVSLEDIKSTDLKKEEMEFHNLLQKKFNSIDDTIEALELKFSDDKGTNEIEFLNDQKAPLSMHKVLSKLYPQINIELDRLGIDFDSDPGNELLINNPNPPKWNTELHYWQQEKDTLQFYVDEFKKLENGIVVDGVYISGWAYYHMCVFIASIPHKIWNEKSKEFVSKDKEINPPLRDSDWMIFENRNIQEKEKYLFMFIAATRRAAKTTAEASMLGHAATIGKKELLCAGASGKDLGQVAKNFKTDILHKNPAFAVYNVANDWEKKVELGIKTKQNKTIPLSTLHIINTDSGNNKEIFAGYTPDLMVLDEAMKEKFLEALEGLLPALRGEDETIRCFGVISGTGGTDSLSTDGLKALSDPETYDILPMQWNILERGIPEEFITWQEDRLKPFGTFIPGQCRVDMPKVESTLADYLGRPESKELKKIKIKITDWEKALKTIEDRRAKVEKDNIKYQKEIVYCPIKPSEIFMSGKQNRFPVNEAKAHKQYLLETGLWDRRRDLYKDSSGRIHAEISKKQLAPFPHSGGIIDAPFLIFEDLPTEKPRYGTYTGGFDDYASDDSETSSVATFYVMKNEILGDPFSNKIVASIAFRPDKHPQVWEKWLMLMEAYNLDQTAFGENFNYGIKDFLDRRHLADKYLAPGLDFSASFNIANNSKRKTGWNPTTSKKFLFDLFVEYCNEDFEIQDQEGNVRFVKGVQRIDDIGLLDEIIQWSENLNVDRITSAMGCVGYAHYLRSSHKWKVLNYKAPSDEDEKPKKKPQREKSFFNTGREKSFFSKRR